MAALVRTYLLCAAGVEVQSMLNTVRDGATRSSPILRELVGGGRTADERRGIDVLWVAFLWNLAMSRIALAYDYDNLPLFALVVCIHISEAFLFLLAVPIKHWRAEYWVVPHSIVQAFVLLIIWLLKIVL